MDVQFVLPNRLLDLFELRLELYFEHLVFLALFSIGVGLSEFLDDHLDPLFGCYLHFVDVLALLFVVLIELGAVLADFFPNLRLASLQVLILLLGNHFFARLFFKRALGFANDPT